MLESLILGALNHLLGQAGWARRQLSGFAGRRARFEMPPWRLAFRIGESGRRDTLMFNGYGDQVASLYSGMDLKANY